MTYEEKLVAMAVSGFVVQLRPLGDLTRLELQ
jgi:hypothetical protein